MERNLTKSKILYYVVNGTKMVGKHNLLSGVIEGLYGDCSKLRGDCSGITGNCSNLEGFCSNISGNVTGVHGCCTEITGDIDSCNITEDERNKGVQISDLVKIQCVD